MNKLESMSLFVRVAELGSFSAVAQQKGMARSVVTRQIAQLEKSLGVKLMTRSTRRLTLTSAGAAYLEKCRVILDLVESAETDLSEANQAPRGAVRITVPLSYGLKRLAPMLLDFAQRYPEVSLDMVYSDRRVNLIEEGVDLAIRITRNLTGTDIVRKLGSSRMRVVASPEYLVRCGRPQHPSQLARHECLAYSMNGGPETWQFDVRGTVKDFPRDARIRANNGDVLSEAAAAGLGITCQPDFIIDDYIAVGRVETILDEYPIPELGIYAILPSNRQIPYRVRVLVDFLAEAIPTAHADH
jgi:DNA-binding transcriptional LysR family regulator